MIEAFRRLRAMLGLLSRVRVLSLKPGDVLVLRYDRELSEDEAHQAAEILRREFPGHRGLVLDDGAEIVVVRDGDPL